MKYILLSLAAICLFSSCYYGVYAPGAVYAPLFMDSGQVTISVHSGESLFNGKAVTVHAGYAYNAKRAILIDYQEYYESSEDRGRQLNVAIGKFKPLDEKKRFISEGFAGVGYLNIRAIDNVKYFVNGLKLYGQADIGYKSRHFDAVVGCRLSALKYIFLLQNGYRMRTGVINSGNAYGYLTAQSLQNGLKIFLEPFGSLRVGNEVLKFEMRCAFLKQIDGVQIPYYYDFFSFGLNFQMPYSHKKKP